MMNHAVQLYDYHVWANQTIFKRLKELPQDICVKEIQSVFPSISRALAHIFTVDHGWFEILSGKSMKELMEFAPSLQEQTAAKTIGEIEAMFIQLSRRYKEFLGKRKNLEERFLLDNPYAGLRETSFAEIVLHVANHGTYHRGNISAMLHQLGHASVNTDYALFWYSN